MYRIWSIRCRGYYLFHHAILCGFYSRAATNRERRLFNSVFSVKSFVIVRALRKASFIRLQNGTYMAPPIRFLVFFQWFHTMITLRVSKIAELLWTAWVLVPIAYTLAIRDMKLFKCACATLILPVASIRERRLFRSARLEVRQQFKTGD